MQTDKTELTKITAWSFRLPVDLLESFKEAAKAENRTGAGALRNLMEKRVADHKAADRDAAKAAA